MKEMLLGSYAVAHGARVSMVEVIAAYPITPQTSIVEKLAEFCSNGTLHARFVTVESEHSAMAACIGASTAGARAFTATSSQGLALMHELLHWAAGARLPIVLANANRALAAPWSIGTDHTDSLSQRDTGWLQFYCESCQECLDTTIQAFKIAEAVSLPVMINLDGFILTHTSEPVNIPEVDRVASYLPPFDPEYKLDVEEPWAFSAGMIGPYAQHYMNFRSKMQDCMEQAKYEAEKADEEFGDVFGRRYGVVNEYCCDDADVVVVAAGTMASTVRAVVKQLRKKNIKAGALKIRMFRPFPSEIVRDILGNAKKVALIDRNLSPGSGGIFSQELKSSLYPLQRRPQVFSFLTGLGGKDITPEIISEIIDYTQNHDEPIEDYLWMGLLK
jgi:pyruvate/2-oxoacid:ferredoxin oxidoreductase alpha subunit